VTDSATAAVPAVSMRGIVKSFGPVEVLKSVDMIIQRGEVHALAGENGAGKSTLMKILQGVHPVTSGEIYVAGERVQIADTHDAESAGIGMVFQEFSLVPSLTVAQNVFLNQERMGRLGLISDREAERAAAEIFADMGVSVDPRSRVENLGTAYWQLVEIAKALAKDAKVLVMDEPTASLAKHEVDSLFALIRRLKDRGIAIVYISHRMDEIRKIADVITVLRDGRVVLTQRVSALTPAEIVEAIIGRRLASELVYQERGIPADAPVLLSARDVSSATVLEGVSVEARAGEIVGLAGLMGSGRTEFARVVAGMDRPTGGRLEIDGKPVVFRNAEAAQRAGVALIPEDRRDQGLVLEHSVSENLTLPVLDRIMNGLLLSTRKARELTQKLVGEYGIRVADPDRPVALLSGGNQQKVVIAKWVNTGPRVLVMDEPTAGVDIGTKTEILEMIRDFASRGNAVIFISSELPELLAVADRVVIFRNGRTIQEIPRPEIRSEEELQLIIQGESAA
jgi:ribose transport system ATP-binding protein